ncbi:arylsulfatase [Adhaeribacter aerolatus]|uniref:Arylsulfatase n=1 Tax=Adhaeribacter aerolatus TaxID=670289 RepID=A0A512B2W9_9BACT|nr:sulfatase-like hydrolase/transferase [Adhaeribacter aerolatus]GEO06299.1 arylsulfatase [Adhaeribacter aerolatus]
MKFSAFIKVCLALTVLLNISFQVLARDKPNIILIMADDLGYETLGCYGNDDKLTPNLDKLAATGMLFENCYSTPLCTPSRVQLMTGKYNNRNYIGFGLLDPAETTFAQQLQKQGYQTAITGKWQLYGYEKQWELAGGRKGSRPENTGFNAFQVWQVDKVGSRYKDPLLYSDNRTNKTHTGKYGEDVFVEYIENFMEENKEKPFMVYYPMCLTHDPFTPTPFSDDYQNFDPKAKKDDPKYFKDMVKYMDHTVGRLTAKLDKLGLREETIIIFTGDNGTSPKIKSRFRGGTYQGNKGQTTERGTHVPLIVNWPGVIKPGSQNKALVDFTDFFPTLTEIAGNTTAAKTLQLDGISFYPQLLGKPAKEREWVFCDYNPKWGTFKHQTYVHNKDFKLYADGRIYNLQKDLDELQPLSKNSLKPQELKLINNFEKVIAAKMDAKK